ncbi:AAA family ATPase [Candidatus Pacearchaeota archaeon CG09_land_8_20_14_0_10_30_9]|nr:MAG: AAA family ATPase [Candidatus Pacearchaeota archaeon CG11_big_fil_rev_8_21_14_0_20_30_13]PIO00790.1 MAG: AAA family ATPase [Candidatus Pacearchaeota archaeon CG09_land_8_20_14_0_10_30_9]PIZ81964.1 MAG: AAA family ATPase [Candidatus Pacearchaeota archaeon CG_4_10_14_0_2_um_filter_30_11]PJA71570.1 MAG: AAA family ATPase [Candidatus Pacearchaeota archaeon CG_4_9_14_3_um_filter_30_11]
MDEIDFTQEPDEGIMEQKRPEQSSKQEELILESKRFIDSYKKELKSSLRDENNVVYVDFMEIAEESPMLSEELMKNPEEALRILEIAIEEMGLIENVRVRLFNLQKSDEVLVRNIRSKHLNELILIEGIIRQSSDVRPQVVNAKFECPSCGTVISVLQIEKKFREPSRCSCGRRGGFKLISKEMVDTQRLIIEEAPDMLHGGEQPKRINVFVKEDLVEPKMEERTTPGARVKVIGILKEVPVPLSTGGMSTRFELAIEVNNIIPMEETFEELDISEEDEQQIQELAADPKLREKLRDSIAPSVWGYEEIKESLLLQLFGGVQKQKTDGQKTRGDIHIMMIGDPGVAKSVILNFMANVSPKGRYIVGKSTSGAGLTASVVRDEYLKGWSLEAGAMVLANKGLVCIDELEKMDPTDQSAMHEAMEQQTVTISKANVQATLKAQTSVLAAANPKFGRFDPSQGIAQQINLPPALINRFDIIFTMRDIPNVGNDTKVADHILEEHQREAKEMIIDKNLFRKYIAYARQRIKPKLTDEAVNKMKEFYVGLRNRPMIEGQEMKSIPISARQLNSLIRMAEATAKLRMSEKVEEEDAKIAIDLLKYYLMQVGFDEETGEIDIDKISGKMKSSQRNKIFLVRDTIHNLTKEFGELVSIEKIEERLEGKSTPEEIEDAIERLAKEGTIFKPRRGFVQKL